MTKPEGSSLQAVESAIESGDIGPLYLVSGDRVLAEPAALRLSRALADAAGCSLEIYKRPAALGPLLADLKTYSLFAPAKVVMAVETAILADTKAAADLIDEALEACPVSLEEGVELSERERRSASRLLQTLRLFQFETASGGAEEVIDALPAWVLEGGKSSGQSRRRRGRRQVEEARQHLAGLLNAARASDLQGWAESEIGELADLVQRGLPAGHALVLAESAVADSHPLVKALAADARYVTVGRVEAAKGGGWQGLELLVAELQRETGVEIAPDAMQELGRRTIQGAAARRGAVGSVDAETTARFAAEYRKLANLSSESVIPAQLVESVVEDRGEEDAWKTLDAIADGHAEEALRRIRRLQAGAADPVAARLSFLALLAGFARQLTALSGLVELARVGRRPVSYRQFKNQIAPKLQADLAEGRKSPVAGLHPYRLYRAYTVVCRVPSERLETLPARVLETERQLKGESSRPDVALTALVCDLATAIRQRS